MRAALLLVGAIAVAALLLVTLRPADRRDDAPVALVGTGGPASRPGALFTLPAVEVQETSGTLPAIAPAAPSPLAPSDALDARLLGGTTREQAWPVAQFLLVAKQGRVSDLPPLFTVSVRTRIDERGWDAYLGAMRAAMRSFGLDEVAATVAFRYEGEADRGVITLLDGERLVGSLQVRIESGRWLIDEW